MGPIHDDNENFLQLYLNYTRAQESPELFHLWTGTTILAAALGRKCWINRGYYRLYPNLFCILVAGSAKCRKSTAVNIGVRLLTDIDTTKVISGKITPEKFIHEIADAQTVSVSPNGTNRNCPNILVHSSELSVFLTKQQYGEPLIHILTDLFDCPDKWPYKTKNKGEAFLHDVFICIIAATTPDGVAQGIPVSALQEGFASRIIFVYQEASGKLNAFPVLSEEEIALSRRLKIMLEERSKISGEFKLDNEAMIWFKQWYLDYMEESPPDQRLAGMFGRKHDHLLRLGMIYAGADRRKLITTNDLSAALMALDNVQATAGGAFMQLGGDNTTQHMTRAISFMKRYKRLSHSELLKKMYPCNAKIFREIVETLMQSHVIARDGSNAHVYVLLDGAGE